MDYYDIMEPVKGLLLFLMLAAGVSSSNGQDDVTTTTILPSSFPVINDYSEEILPKTVLTVVCFTAAILAGMIIAKLVEYCLERASISDNASDMSDYTRNLLKAQLMLAFNKGKKGQKQKPEDIAKKYGKMWFGKTSRNKARRIKATKVEAGADSTASGNTLTVPGANKSPKKTPVIELKMIDETKKRGDKNRSSTVTPPTANSGIGRNASTRASTKTPHSNSVAPVEATAKSGASGQTSNTNNNAADKSSTAPKQGDGTVSTASKPEPSDANKPNASSEAHSTKAGTTTRPPSPTKPPVKATVNKTNVGSRPVSSGLKKPGVARPVSSRAPRPPTAKSRQTKA